MATLTIPELRDRLVLTRDFLRVGDHSTIARSAHRDRLARVTTGAYMDRIEWEALGPDERFLALAAADTLLHPRDRPKSHMTAAAVWGLPIVGAWPARLEAWVDPSVVLASRARLQRRPGLADPNVVTIEGIDVTSLARTVVDVARTRRTAVAVAMIDRVLAGDVRGASRQSTRDELLAELAALGTHGSVKARAAIEFGDAAAANAGESASRCAMHALGFALPELQHPIFDDAGLVGYVDFWWPEVAIAGEFDGIRKYVKPEYMGGRSVEQVVLDEKRREDRVRRVTRGVARWDWADVIAPRRLEAILLGAGVPRSRRFSAV